MRVVADQDRALAAVLLRTAARTGANTCVERVALGLGVAERVVEVDAGDLQRLRVDLGARRRHDMAAGDLADDQLAVFIEIDRRHRDLEQRVAVPVEAAGFHVDDHRQEAAEAGGERGAGGRGLACSVMAKA